MAIWRGAVAVKGCALVLDKNTKTDPIATLDAHTVLSTFCTQSSGICDAEEELNKNGKRELSLRPVSRNNSSDVAIKKRCLSSDATNRDQQPGDSPTVVRDQHQIPLAAAIIKLNLSAPQSSNLPTNNVPVTLEKLSLTRKRDRRQRRIGTVTGPFLGLFQVVASSSTTRIRLDGEYTEEDDSAHLLLTNLANILASSNSRNDYHQITCPSCDFIPPSRTRPYFELQFQLLWKAGYSSVDLNGGSSRRLILEKQILDSYVRFEGDQRGARWSLQDFYDSVHITSPSCEVAPDIQSKILECNLYPFQRRAVDWLLRREGVTFDHGKLVPWQVQSSERVPPPSFARAEPAYGPSETKFYASRERVMVITDPMKAEMREPLRGGILAEEMGLGKTVELIALIALHERSKPQAASPETAGGVTISSATLIVTPPSLIQQWKTEIDKHAASLKVHIYTGIPSPNAKPIEHEQATVKFLIQYDIVLTTYNDLSKEIHFATPPPDRSLRGEKKYPLCRSPLVEIEWWRVCLDEAQMVESGVSQAATVARLIPRVNAWAISGTPLRKNVQDLRGLLIFLGYEPYCSSTKLWNSIDKATFKQLFKRIALRHTKASVRHELTLPAQKRVVITVPFTPIEEQNYTQLFRDMCEEVGLAMDGSPLQGDWDPTDPDTVNRMRRWLVRLRQTCLHPQVGGKNRKALGRNAPLRTVAEVLDVMVEQNETLIRAEECDYVAATLVRGHIYAYAKNIPDRARRALDIYEAALKQSDGFAQDCRDDLNAEVKKTNTSAEVRDDIDSDDEEEAEKAVGRVGALRNALRRALEVQHACNFFIGTAYYQMKTNEELVKAESEEFFRLEKLEMEFYDKAKTIRKELLHENHFNAEQSMRKLSDKVIQHGLAHISFLEDPKDLEDAGGIENRKILDKMDEFSDLINGQGQLLKAWRKKVVDMLLLPLVDEDDKETTGDEYEDSTKQQDELYVYITALRALVADRHQMLTGQENYRVKEEVKVALAQAKKGEGHAPELFIKLMAARGASRRFDPELSLRGIISELRSMETSVEWSSHQARAATELQIIKQHLKQLQEIFNSEMKLFTSLEAEQAYYHSTMNRRVKFYSQLQQISDTVQPYKEELEVIDHEALDTQEAKEGRLANNLAAMRTKRRFLHHLKEESSTETGPRVCVICTGPIHIGSLTVCGHQYCKDCLGIWLRQHRTCPMCKKKLSKNDFHDITYKPQELKAIQEDTGQSDAPEGSSSAGSPESIPASLYSDISNATMDEIKTIDLEGSYGTKIDTISRHVLWLRKTDPGSKCIIFSQYSDFLNVLCEAFRKFKIGFSSIASKGGIEKFRNDASVEVFLLDAKSNSSGLNLVNATHVFLCEPLINPAIELQAIARVHRIGQQRPTTVTVLLVSDTVEQAIYEISVTRRLEHIGKGSRSNSQTASRAVTPGVQENAIEAANSLEMQKAPLATLIEKKGGGEIVSSRDLWSCLFSKPRQQQAPVSAELEREVGRHVRVEAALRRAGADEGTGDR